MRDAQKRTLLDKFVRIPDTLAHGTVMKGERPSLNVGHIIQQSGQGLINEKGGSQTVYASSFHSLSKHICCCCCYQQTRTPAYPISFASTLGSKFPGLQPCTKAESKLQGSLPVQCAEGRCPLLGYVAINSVG